MNDHWFDRASKAMAGDRTRRGLLRGVAALAVGAVTASGVSVATAAQGRPTGATCFRATDCATGYCDPKTRRCTCPAGQIACNGTCVASATFQTDIRNCGGCGNSCPVAANEIATCTAGVCGTSCAFVTCGAICCASGKVCNADYCDTPPVANADTYVTDQDTTLTVPTPGVLANDTDPEGCPLTATLVSGPTNGTLTLNPDGSFTYVPNANFFGTDSFTYAAVDYALLSSPATVTITVNEIG